MSSDGGEVNLLKQGTIPRPCFAAPRCWHEWTDERRDVYPTQSLYCNCLERSLALIIVVRSQQCPSMRRWCCSASVVLACLHPLAPPSPPFR